MESPQRRKHNRAICSTLPLTIRAVAECTLVCINLLPVAVVELRWFRQFWISSSRQLRACWSSLGKEIRVAFQGDHYLAIQGRSFAVHAVKKAILQSLPKRVHMPVFCTVGWIHDIGRPKWTCICKAPSIEVTVRAPQGVSDKLVCVALRITDDLLTEAHHVTKLIVGNFASPLLRLAKLRLGVFPGSVRNWCCRRCDHRRDFFRRGSFQIALSRQRVANESRQTQKHNNRSPRSRIRLKFAHGFNPCDVVAAAAA